MSNSVTIRTLESATGRMNEVTYESADAALDALLQFAQTNAPSSAVTVRLPNGEILSQDSWDELPESVRASLQDAGACTISAAASVRAVKNG
jgi:hypothetical protein